MRPHLGVAERKPADERGDVDRAARLWGAAEGLRDAAVEYALAGAAVTAAPPE